jgi:hypothetical protein
MATMATLTAFCDAAGHPEGEHTLIVCGYVAEAAGWTEFEQQWKNALADVGITGPFHMAEFMACEKSFAGWKPRVDDRVALLKKLISIIRINVLQAFSETIRLDDWREVNKAYQLEESHCTPYSLAGFFVMDRTIRWWGRERPEDSMTEFVFEEGDKHKGDFIWMMERIVRQNRTELGIVTPVFKPKALAPLQAADLDGWIMRRAFKVEITKEPERSLPAALVEAMMEIGRIPHISGDLGQEHITKFCEAHGVPNRGQDGPWKGVVRR